MAMQLTDFYDAFIVDKRHTGIDYPVWVIWDEELPPVVGISNIPKRHDCHNDIFFVSIENGAITNIPKIPTDTIEQIQRWVLYNKLNLMCYSKGQCDISEVLKPAKVYVTERTPITV